MTEAGNPTWQGAMPNGTVPPRGRDDITGLVLAGGLGTRMQGRDKGLIELGGSTMIERVVERLRPQVGPLLISANRNLSRYRELELPVLEDPAAVRHCGPLAGLLAGLTAATTSWLAVVPCDAPRLPADLVARLASALERGDLLALASDGVREQPLFCLLSRSMEPDLAAWLAAGKRSVTGYFARPPLRRRLRLVDFSDSAENFLNINRPEDRAGFSRSAELAQGTGESR